MRYEWIRETLLGSPLSARRAAAAIALQRRTLEFPAQRDAHLPVRGACMRVTREATSSCRRGNRVVSVAASTPRTRDMLRP